MPIFVLTYPVSPACSDFDERKSWALVTYELEADHYDEVIDCLLKIMCFTLKIMGGLLETMERLLKIDGCMLGPWRCASVLTRSSSGSVVSCLPSTDREQPGR